MKRREFRNMPLALAIMLVLAACADNGGTAGSGTWQDDGSDAMTVVEDSEASGGNEEATSDDKDAAIVGDLTAEKEAEDRTGGSKDEASEGENTVWLKEQYSSDLVCIADMSGKVLGEYTIESIGDIVKKSFDSFVPETFLFEKDGILYYNCNEKDDGQNTKAKAIFAVDPEAGSASKVIDYAYEDYLDTFDYYKDAFRMAILEGKYGEKRNYRVLKVTKDPDKLVYNVEEDDNLKSLYDMFSEYNLHVDRNENRMECYERIIDELGFVIREKDDRYYRITADGMAEEIRGLPDNMSYVSAYDSNYMFFPCYDDNYNIEGIYVYSGMEERARRLNINSEYDYFISYADGRLYYCDREEEEYGIDTAELRYMDISGGTNGSVLKRTKIPGTRLLEPLDDVIIKENKVFFRDFADGKVSWFMADIDDAKKTLKNLGIETAAIDTFDYGEVTYVSATENCPFCGTELTKVYAEIFVLDNGYSKKADKINASIKDMMDEKTALIGKGLENMTDAECSEHKLYPRQYCETDDYTVDRVRIIDGRFLTVEMSGYWYGGGAHGYPSREEYLFDLTTGEKMTMKDFFHGTEDDFKKLIALKVKEDYESYDVESGNYRPYFAGSAEDAYEQAYSYVNFEDLLFEDTGICYYFYPYNLASYADGFIEVNVSYEELLGRKTLEE